MNLYKTFLVAALICIATCLRAQPGGGHGHPCPRPPCPPPVPITGIEVLLGIGGIYGARRLVKLSAKKNP